MPRRKRLDELGTKGPGSEATPTPGLTRLSHDEGVHAGRQYRARCRFRIEDVDLGFECVKFIFKCHV